MEAFNQFDPVSIKHADYRRFGPFLKPKAPVMNSVDALFPVPFSKNNHYLRTRKNVIRRTNAKFLDGQTHNNSYLLSHVDHVTVCIFKFCTIGKYK